MKNFFDCKDEKITEKAFSQSLIISVVSILLCLVALCSMTYAWFTGSTSSGNNTLVSGSFDVKIDIEKLNDDEIEAIGTENTVVLENGIYTLEHPGKYRVTLTPTEGTTVKGYCVVRINDDDDTARRTGVITNEKTESDDYKSNSPFTFTIVVTEETKVEIEAHWGVPAVPVIEVDEIWTVGDIQTNTEENEVPN